MKKCLLLLVVLSLAFTAGSAIRCYMCAGDDCRDPYTGNKTHEITCPKSDTHCRKIDIDKGRLVLRLCGSVTSVLGSKELNEHLAAMTSYDTVSTYCNGADLCNGAGLCDASYVCNASGRLAAISTMMILLPASLVLLISFFSRL